MAQTFRLPDALKSEADEYAGGLGISLNALVAVALRDYLDGRRAKRGRAPVQRLAPSGSVGTEAARGGRLVAERSDGTSRRIARASQSLNSPCACGSGRKYKRCCGAAT